VGYSVITLLQIYCCICGWNSFKNLWTFGEVMGKMVVSHILCAWALSCIKMKNLPSILHMLLRSCC